MKKGIREFIILFFFWMTFVPALAVYGEDKTDTEKTLTQATCYHVQKDFQKVSNKINARPGIPELQKVKAIAYNQVEISWSKVKEATGYRVYWRKGNGEWKRVKTVKGKTSWVCTGNAKHPIEPGITYSFKVKAYKNVRGRNIYGEFCERILSVKTKPETVKLVSADCVSGGKIKITWKASYGADRYIIYRKTKKSGWIRVAKVYGNRKTSYTQTSSRNIPIKEGETYWYTVQSYTTNGQTYGSYNHSGLRVVAETGTRDEISAKTNARKIVAQITDSSMSKSEKLQTCFDWVIKKYYRIWRSPSLKSGWTGAFANDHFLHGCGCCISDACAFAYLAWALGYRNVYVCLDSETDLPEAHGWTEINGKVYDPLFAEAKSYYGNYGVSYGAYGLYPEVKTRIK